MCPPVCLVRLFWTVAVDHEPSMGKVLAEGTRTRQICQVSKAWSQDSNQPRPSLGKYYTVQNKIKQY